MDTNVIIAEIQDVMDENAIHPDFVSNFKSVTDTLGNLRTNLRNKHQLIQAEETNHPISETITNLLNEVKLYIKTMIGCKSKLDLA